MANVRRPRPLLLVALVVLAAASAPGCGKYARRGGTSKPETTENVHVGAGVGDLVKGAPTTVAVGTAPPTTIHELGANEGLAPNQTGYDSPEGFRLTLTVKGSLKYRPGDSIDLEVLARNVSKRDLQIDANDLKNFAFRPVGSTSTVWTDANCRGGRVPSAVEGPAQTLHPDEQAVFRDTYPGPADFANRDQCRVPNGTYAVFGFVSWCPPGSTDSAGKCNPQLTRQISSAGVKITIG